VEIQVQEVDAVSTWKELGINRTLGQKRRAKRGKQENGKKEKEDHPFPFFSYFLFCSASLEGMA